MKKEEKTITELEKYYGYIIPSHIDQSLKPPVMKRQFCCELCSTCLDMDISGRNNELTLKCMCDITGKELHPDDNITECEYYEESGHSHIKEILYD
jgi:flavoprotein